MHYLDHCRPCSDARFSGNGAHHGHTQTIEHGPVAGLRCACPTCALAWIPPWYVRVVATLVDRVTSWMWPHESREDQ